MYKEQHGKLEKYYIILFFIYFSTICFLYPYGISFSKEISFRISDLFAIFITFFGLLVIIISNRIKKDFLFIFFPIFPFLFLEFLLPLFGSVYFSSFDGIINSIRIVFLFAPILIFVIYFGKNSIANFDRILEKNLTFILILNGIYSLIQFFVVNSYLPETFLITRYFEPYAVDEQYKILDSTRVSGFFVNSTALSLFSILCFIFYFAKYVFLNKSKYLLLSILSLFLILLSGSRVAYIVAIIVLLLNFIYLKWKQKIYILLILVALTLILIALFDKIIDPSEYFIRIIRLRDGLENDYSLALRLEYTWPSVLKGLESYPFGTLLQPTLIFGLIDSGYLTYYAQGKWLFIAAILLMIISYLIKSIKGLILQKSIYQLMIINISIYILIALLVSNPLRSPVLLFFYLIFIYFSYLERRNVNEN